VPQKLGTRSSRNIGKAKHKKFRQFNFVCRRCGGGNFREKKSILKIFF
jgi:hypothetical protein